MTFPSPSTLRRIAAVLSVAALVACSNEPAASRLGSSFSRSGGAGGSGGRTLVTSGARYSDTGAHPATGRSGSAAIAAQAVFSHDGQTVLTVTPYSASDLSFLSPLGCLDKVQVKAFGADGKLRWTQNFNNLGLASGAAFTTTLFGLLPGMTLQVQANVKCIDGRRTDVVTATPHVVRQTDPAVVALMVPSQSPVNTPTLVMGKIQELNGDLGATGTCYLYVNGTLADSIPRVWVDAGSSVDCSFAPTFGAVSTPSVRVDFGNVTPLDADPSNNSRAATLNVVAFSTLPASAYLAPFMVTASVYDDTLDIADLFLYSERLAANPSVLIDTLYQADSTRGNAQFAGFTGIIYSSVAFPLARLAVSQASGATTYHALALTNVAAAGSPSAGMDGCTDQSSGAVSLVVCSYSPDQSFPYGHTVVAYVRETTNAAYMSTQYYVAYSGGVPSGCDMTSTDQSANCYFVQQPLGAALAPYGSTYTFNVLLETATRRYSSTVTIPLSSAPLPVTVPFQCNDVPINNGILYHACESTTGSDVRKSGDVPSLVGLTQALP